uniref:Uncharacterized protein n=1 Tax=Knipowitschia caucasica TaxID=637954 RepID=A0AAV2JPS0_KNICA
MSNSCPQFVSTPRPLIPPMRLSSWEPSHTAQGGAYMPLLGRVLFLALGPVLWETGNMLRPRSGLVQSSALIDHSARRGRDAHSGWERGVWRKTYSVVLRMCPAVRYGCYASISLNG